MVGLDLALTPSCPHSVVQMLVPLVPLVAFPYQKRMDGGTDVWCGAVSLFGLLVSHSCNLKVDFLKNKCDASKRKKGFLFPGPLFSLHWFI